MNMTQHIAKKVCAGEYYYRGWSISHVYSESYRDWTWVISNTDHLAQGRSWFDPTTTLQGAKLAIDAAIASGDAVEI